MYQGKFDKKKKGTGVSVEEIVSSRNTASPAKKQAPIPEPAPKKRSVPFDQDASPRGQSVKAPSTPRKPAQAAPQRKGPRLGGVIFYTLYFLFIFLFFVCVYFGLNWLNGWLVDFEAAQPTAKAEEVFQQLFQDPDWGALYDAAGVSDTIYEGKDAFVNYMENLVGDSTLTYQETSSGLSEDSKYFVKLGDQRLAYFTLTNRNSASGNDQHLADIPDIPDWVLGSVGLFFERSNGYRIQTVDGHIPHVNGTPLTEDHVIQVSTIKEDTSGFLPTNVNPPKTSIYEITGLLAEPTITVTDNSGAQREVSYDPSTGMYVEKAETIAMSEEERNVALEALKVYARYGIKEATGAEVGKYFDSTGSAYKSIMQTVLSWTKGNNGISFDNDTVTNYCRYSDTMFSAYVTTELTIKLTDGGTQTKSINSTLLFSKQSGSWKVTKMTNANLAESVGKVRLTFMNNGEILSSDFYDMESTSLSTPLLSVPSGKVFSGWMTETVKEDGTKTMTLVFQPDENGDITIPKGTTLTPMVLYPLFENA